MMDRGEERETVLFWLDRGEKGGADVLPHLQCSARLNHPIISQLSVEGAGLEADDSQGEFSVRQTDGEHD